MTKRKRLTLILLGIVLLALLLLAAGLAQVRFSPGEPFTLQHDRPLSPSTSGAPAEITPTMRWLLRAWLTLMLALLPFSIFYLLISPNARRRVLRNLIVLGVFLLIMSSLGQQLSQLGENGLLGGLNMTGLSEGGAPVQPAEFTGSAPGWLIFLASFIVAAIVVAVSAGLIYGYIRARRRRQPEPDPLVRIAEEAESTLTAIEAGGDLRDVVIRCYLEMNRIVRESRGLLRQQAMTAREFEEQLQLAGLPGDSIRDLTRLFEAARYGAKDLSAGQEARATACLAAIAGACRALVKDEG